MILADKIIDLRKKAGWSQEELAERLGVSRQSISKWESAQSVPDMNRVLALADLFGVTTDYLLRDDMESADMITQPIPADDPGGMAARGVSMEEANDFLRARDRAAGRVAVGVMLCILSPIPLILLTCAQESGRLDMLPEQAAGLGLAPLLILVATAVALFITTHLRMNRFEYMEKEYIDTAYGVDGMVRERQERFRPAYIRGLTLGIVLCVIAALPLFFAMGLGGVKGSWPGELAVAALLVLVALGVQLIVRSSMINDGFQMLLETGEYTRASKLENRRNAGISAIYWGAALAVYFLWSFLSGRWDRTWIVWPVAGVLYGALRSVLRIIRGRT